LSPANDTETPGTETGMNRILRAGLIVAAPFIFAAAGCSQPAEQTTEAAAPLEPTQVMGGGAIRLDPAFDQVVAPATPIMKVATGFKFIEGPVWRNGELWFSDLMSNTYHALAADGSTRVLMDKSGGLDSIPEGSYQGSNGSITGADGALLLAQHGVRRIAKLDDNFVATTFIDSFEGKKLNSPNDMAFHSDGSLWFTDPPYGLTGQDQDPAKEQAFNGVYRWTEGQMTAPIRDMTRPNGLDFSPDGKVLYVANSGPEMYINRYDVRPDGSVTGGRRFAEFPQRGAEAPADVPDGLKVDTAGNVWATGPGGIRVIAPDGRIIGQIRLPEVAANLIFGGPDLKTLYILGSTSVYTMPTLVAGKAPVYPK